MHYKGLVYYFVKCFLGYIFLYIQLSPEKFIFHISLLCCFLHGYKYVLKIYKVWKDSREGLTDYEWFWDTLFSFS